MLAKQISKFADVLGENEICKNDDKAIVIYGINTGLKLFLNLLTTIALGFLFGLVIESIVFTIFFSFIRTYAGGYHCKSAINCYFVSSGIITLVLSMVKFTPENYLSITSVMMVLVSLPIIIKFAPVETPTKLFDEREKIHFRKKTLMHLTIECVLITLFIVAELYIFSYIISLGILISAALVLWGKIAMINVDGF